MTNLKNTSHFNILGNVPRLAGKFPFRLGTTSYIVPADLLPNVQALAGFVDDVEVVLFESEEISNLPTPQVIAEMANVQKNHQISFTIHFPLDVDLGGKCETDRTKHIEQCLRIVDLTVPLSPFGYVLHLPLLPISHDSEAQKRWLHRCCTSIRQILDRGVSPRLICVETLSYPFELAFPVVETLELSVCLDVGHVLLNSFDLAEYYDKYFSRTRVIHLHGINEKKDHCSLAYLPVEILNDLLVKLSQAETNRVLTMEIFGEEDFASSMRVMAKHWQKVD
ncbi:MAG: sugar phosphate isomerase/epimerase [Deltaproteobacteria bacterium]|nr:sugar phosphate isomerase/epimerase [Deltaproteobacteria bacterium]MBN2674513.1 sugar phosphate isomerase/epimerase [Deltaproteobacteria bacterium]